jgi:hypothetical protein
MERKQKKIDEYPPTKTQTIEARIQRIHRLESVESGALEGVA